MLWVATEREEVGNVATPAPLSVAVPNVLVPSLNVTVPVGVPEAGLVAVTVAVNVTDWPKTDGLADEVRVVLLEAWLTFCVNAVDVLPVKLESPP
jgi:hypothetical protein